MLWYNNYIAAAQIRGLAAEWRDSMNSLIHIYTGNGKGKTTAAIGLSVRYAGSGGKVVFSQFLKDNKSSELNILNKIEGIELVPCDEFFGFYSKMNDETKDRAKVVYNNYLRKIIDLATQKDIQMLILDEVIGAYNYGLIEREILLQFLRNKPDQLEVILTGRNPDKELLELADYVSEITKVKHPYDKGIQARVGIER
jgi:cob(I)alamin adenosyltransferase